MEKKIFLLGVLVLLLTGCHGQQKTNTMGVDSMIDEMLGKIKRYPQEPVYYMGVQSSARSFQILVNDMPLLRFYDKGGLPGTQKPINYAVLKSGQQRFTVKIYPGKVAKGTLAYSIGAYRRT